MNGFSFIVVFSYRVLGWAAASFCTAWINASPTLRGLLQPFQFGVDGGSAGEVGVEGGLFGVHRGLRVVIDDEHMNALFYREAKLFLMQFASNTTPKRPDLIDCNLCY